MRALPWHGTQHFAVPLDPDGIAARDAWRVINGRSDDTIAGRQAGWVEYVDCFAGRRLAWCEANVGHQPPSNTGPFVLGSFADVSAS